MTWLFILDSLGTSELLVILGAALIFFGPRKLPQLSRQIGKSLAEFRRASEDFKRTWEREVNLENFEKGVEPQENSILDKAAERIRAAREAVTEPGAIATASKNPIESGDLVATAPGSDTIPPAIAPAVTPVDPALVQPRASTSESKPANAEPATSKHEWL